MQIALRDRPVVFRIAVEPGIKKDSKHVSSLEPVPVSKRFPCQNHDQLGSCHQGTLIFVLRNEDILLFIVKIGILLLEARRFQNQIHSLSQWIVPSLSIR